MSESIAVTQRTQVKRGPKRAVYDRDTLYAIIDEALMCHVAQLMGEQPFVTPTCHWRDGDYFYWHGHAAARNIQGALKTQVCINISLLDGLVLARSAFHHSVNYRSVTLFGVPELVEDEAEKMRHLEIFMEKVAPGRWPLLRPVLDKELKATGILRIPLNEASAKVRAAPPVDDEEDYNWPVWAGVLPITRQMGEPEPDPRLQNQDWPLRQS